MPPDDPPVDPPETPEPPPPPETPEPPAPQAELPANKRDAGGELREARKALEAERRSRAKAEQRVRELESATQSDTERAIEKARAEGYNAAKREAGVRIAAEKVKALGVGKLADPTALLEVMDLGKYIDEDGEPDDDALARAIERLAAAPEKSSGKLSAPRIPNGVQPEAHEGDWIRAAIAKG